MTTLELPISTKEDSTFMKIGDLPVCKLIPSVYRMKDDKIYIKTAEFVQKIAKYDEENHVWYPIGDPIELDPKQSVEVIQIGEDYIVNPNINRNFFLTVIAVVIIIATVALFVSSMNK